MVTMLGSIVGLVRCGLSGEILGFVQPNLRGGAMGDNDVVGWIVGLVRCGCGGEGFGFVQPNLPGGVAGLLADEVADGVPNGGGADAKEDLQP
ncbi:hypothetical protein N836_01665 [Leptolyngbya sp. Heron Island J]|nr:hypothetical protein N836_01665 [Leptolyngbya sp. Heron Island J]